MNQFKPSYTIERDDVRCEIHWTACGLWSAGEAEALTKALFKKSLPFIEAKKSFRVLGDVREFHVQSKEVVEIMEGSQRSSAELGVDRMAIVYSSTLVKMQFRRISEMLEAQFFEDREAALEWLRQG
jgi:hypothetical protein